MSVDDRRRAIVKELRTYLGTPWRHLGRVKGEGIDCIGIGLVAAKMAGMMEGKTESELGIPNYGRLPHADTFRKILTGHLIKIPRTEVKIADVVFIALRIFPMHMGILANFRHDGTGAPFTMIHAMVETAAVSEMQHDPMHPKYTVVGYYRFPTLVE